MYSLLGYLESGEVELSNDAYIYPSQYFARPTKIAQYSNSDFWNVMAIPAMIAQVLLIGYAILIDAKDSMMFSEHTDT